MTRAWACGVATIALLAAGCVGPVAGLWPPAPDAPTREVVVSIDSWHAMLAFPVEGEASGVRREAGPPRDGSALLPLASSPEPRALLGEGGPSSPLAWNPEPRTILYEEWGYAEQAWYLEGEQGVLGVLRALFWPSAGVVEIGYHGQPWSQRTPQPPAEAFRFRLSEEGYARLRAYLRASLASDDPVLETNRSAFYRAQRSYTVFNTCHHYAARALREAGLPVSSFWALTRSLLAAQLRRAEQMASPRPAEGASAGEEPG